MSKTVQKTVKQVENRRKIKLLQQYVALQKEAKLIYDSYREFKAKITSIQSLIITDMPGAAAQQDKIGNMLAKLEQLEHKINARVKELVVLRTNIEDAIEGLGDPVERMILTLRYISNMSWEKIAVEMNYAWAQIHRMHSKALEKIRI